VVALFQGADVLADVNDDAGALMTKDRREQAFGVSAGQGVFVRVATNTSPSRGPSRSIGSRLSGSPALRATAARVFIMRLHWLALDDRAGGVAPDQAWVDTGGVAMILFHQYPESMDGSSDKTEDFIDRAAAAVPRRMSYELEEQDDWQAALNHPATVTAGLWRSLPKSLPRSC
jgi:hypothetical protein